MTTRGHVIYVRRDRGVLVSNDAYTEAEFAEEYRLILGTLIPIGSAPTYDEAYAFVQELRAMLPGAM